MHHLFVFSVCRCFVVSASYSLSPADAWEPLIICFKVHPFLCFKCINFFVFSVCRCFAVRSASYFSPPADAWEPLYHFLKCIFSTVFSASLSLFLVIDGALLYCASSFFTPLPPDVFQLGEPFYLLLLSASPVFASSCISVSQWIGSW